MKPDPFLLGLRLEGQSVLVVGSGAEAEARSTALLDAGAEVLVVSTDPTGGLRQLAQSGRLRLEERPFDEADLASVWLAVLTDVDAELAERIGSTADACRVFFCAVDQPAWSSYSHVALARSGGVTVAVSTGGRAPSLARRIREELQRLLDEANVEEFVARLAKLREGTPSEDRREVLGEAVKDVRFTGRIDLPQSPRKT